MPSEKPRIFISYARADSGFALKLGKDLLSAGAYIWLDKLEIVSGEHWDDAVEKALNTCGSFLVILSGTSVESQNVKDELSFALGEKKQVIPVLYQSCQIPFRVKRIQYSDFTDDYDTGLKQLLNALNIEQRETEKQSMHEFQKPMDEIEPDIEAQPEDIIEMFGKVFKIGDRVRILMQCGKIKPNETGHAAEVHTGKGQIGTIIHFQKKGVPSYLSADVLRGLPKFLDPDSIEVALVRWDRQTWIECGSNKAVTIDEFESRINVQYLEVIDKSEF